jgi:predicted Zn-dependent protease
VKPSRVLAVLVVLCAGGSAAAQTLPASQASFKNGRALMDAKKPAEAADQFDAVTKAEPDFAGGWYALAAARRKAGQCDLAIPAYRRYAQMSPGEAEPYYGLGLCLKETGQLASASQALRRYVAIVDLNIRPSAQKWVDHAKSVIEEIGNGVDAPRPAAATPAAKSPAPAVATPAAKSPAPAAAAPPGGPTPRASDVAPTGPAAEPYARAMRLRDTGHIEEAIAAFREAIGAEPQSRIPRLALGELLLKIRRDSEAIDVFRGALREAPDSALGWYELAFAFRVRGRLPEAVDAYEHYIKLKPADPDPYYGLARSLQKLGKKDEARKAYETYVSLEKRPSEQKWIDAARTELRALGAGAP